jgi:very-short-patch-repair endonuclease
VTLRLTESDLAVLRGRKRKKKILSPAEMLRKEQRKAEREKWEAYLLRDIRAMKLPEPLRNHIFALPRQWAFDFAWKEQRLAAECDGGTWSGGRHSTGKGYEEDCHKINAATLLGWRVLRFTGDMIVSGAALTTIEQALRQRKAA